MNWLERLLLPEQATQHAASVDTLFMFLVWLSVFFFVLIAGLLFYSVVKFRRRSPHDVTPHITHHTGLELLWSIVPLIIVIGLFFWGLNGYLEAFIPPGDAMEIQVTGKKWLWQFEYPNGVRTINEIHVPAGKAVKLILSAEDVIHGFFIPTMRIKHDAVPNRYSQMWFQANEPGVHTVECTFYCGKSHSDMLAKLVVEDDTRFQEWLDNGGEDPALTKGVPPARRGARLYESKGCNSCHSLDGTRGQGPSWRGIYGQKHRMVDGKEVLVDENYIRTSILQPQSMVVQGFEPIMPVFQGVLNDRDVEALTAFIKEQK